MTPPLGPFAPCRKLGRACGWQRWVVCNFAASTHTHSRVTTCSHAPPHHKPSNRSNEPHEADMGRWGVVCRWPAANLEVELATVTASHFTSMRHDSRLTTHESGCAAVVPCPRTVQHKELGQSFKAFLQKAPVGRPRSYVDTMHVLPVGQFGETTYSSTYVHCTLGRCAPLSCFPWFS